VARTDHGFSLVELLFTVAIIAIMSALALPVLSGASRRSALAAAQREVAGQIRSARFAAVTANRTMHVRFNCPATGQYRVLEITGDTSIDGDTNRCSYLWPDPDPAVLPNLDGPIMQLPEGITFSATQNLQIGTTGTITPLSGSSPATIQVADGSVTRQVTASAAGRVQAP
jgi:prepilin-type N-terminal cleavage/methylation domain-containing protein